MKLAKEMKDDSKGRIRVAFTSFLQICLLSAGQKLVRMHTWTRILRHFSSRHGERQRDGGRILDADGLELRRDPLNQVLGHRRLAQISKAVIDLKDAVCSPKVLEIGREGFGKGHRQIPPPPPPPPTTAHEGELDDDRHGESCVYGVHVRCQV